MISSYSLKLYTSSSSSLPNTFATFSLTFFNKTGWFLLLVLAGAKLPDGNLLADIAELFSDSFFLLLEFDF